MERKKINFRKPVEFVSQLDREYAKLALYNADGNRVVWANDRVYPIDNYGCVIATIQYPTKKAYVIGDQIIRNVELKEYIVLVKTSDAPTWNVYEGRPSTLSYAEGLAKNIERMYKDTKIVKV